MLQNKRLSKAKDLCWTLDQELYAKCRQLFNLVGKDCEKLDRLHAKVLEAEKKMGGKPACGMVEGKCISCIRNAEREAAAASAAAEMMAVKERQGGSGKTSGGNSRKATKGKQKLEDILEEGESGDGGGKWR